MATKYLSNLWVPRSSRGTTSAGVETTTTSYDYRGPYSQRAGEAFDVFGTYAVTAANPFDSAATDQLLICPIPKGGIVVDFQWATTADLDTDNDFTCNLGWTGSLTALLSASTGLQAAVTSMTRPALTLTGLTGGGPTNNTSNLILSAQAGELEAAGTLIIFARILNQF